MGTFFSDEHRSKSKAPVKETDIRRDYSSGDLKMRLRIMSNNQWRCDENKPWWKERGLDCSAETREQGFIRFYTETAPDIIALQEVSPLMLEKLLVFAQKAGLKYAAVWGKDTPILYRSDLFELIDSSFLIYPETIPGHDGSFNNSDTKSYCAGVFRCKANGKLLSVMSTHLWWKSSDPSSAHYQPYSDEARASQINLAIDELDRVARKYHIPQLLLGDLNSVYDSAALKAAFDRSFDHAHDIADEYRDETNGMHPCGPEELGPYTARGFREAIDHILIRGYQDVQVKRFERSMPDYYLLLSDHAPVWIDIVS